MAAPPLAGLHAFLTVAEHGGFSAAARTLGVTPSALSQSVRGLETRVGVPLLVRTTRSVALTEAGRALVDRVGPALRDTLAALDEVGASSDHVRGTLKITAGRIAVPQVIDPVLPPLLDAHPELRIELSVADRMVDIVAAGFDAGVRLSEAIEPDMSAVRLTNAFRFLVVAAPRWLACHRRPEVPSDLLDHDCILYRRPTTGLLYAWELEHEGREETVAVRGRVCTDDGGFALGAARAGLGLAYLDELSIRGDLAAGTLVPVLEAWAPTVPGFFLYFPRRAQRQPKLRAFLDTALRVLAPGPTRPAS